MDAALEVLVAPGIALLVALATMPDGVAGNNRVLLNCSGDRMTVIAEVARCVRSSGMGPDVPGPSPVL
jgi:hypothetical protein